MLCLSAFHHLALMRLFFIFFSLFESFRFGFGDTMTPVFIHFPSIRWLLEADSEACWE